MFQHRKMRVLLCAAALALLCLALLSAVAWAAIPNPANALATGPTVTIKSATLNVRAGPGTNYAVIGSAKKGQTFEAKARTTDSKWLQICCINNKTGWVMASLVTATGDVASLPVPADIPPPAAAAAKPAKKAGGPSGTLFYSMLNRDQKRWELWQHNFASGKSSFLKEWRTEVAFSKDYKQALYYAWPPVVGEDKAGIYAANASDLSGERMVIEGGSYPSYSPDMGRLAAQGGDTMYILNPDGSGLRAFDDGEYPAWSPIDNWIAHRGCYGPDCGLWLTHADSGERRRLTTGGGDGQPAWSPDGKRIAYISKDDGNFEIYVINSDGSGKVRLSNSPQSDGLPVWSPDGQWIAYRSDRDGKWAIWVMRPDGKDARKVVDADVLPLWFWEKMAWKP